MYGSVNRNVKCQIISQAIRLESVSGECTLIVDTFRTCGCSATVLGENLNLNFLNILAFDRSNMFWSEYFDIQKMNYVAIMLVLQYLM